MVSPRSHKPMAHVCRAVASFPDSGVQIFVGADQFHDPHSLVANRWADDTGGAVVSWEVHLLHLSLGRTMSPPEILRAVDRGLEAQHDATSRCRLGDSRFRQPHLR